MAEILIPLKIKEIKYPKDFGRTTGGVFTTEVMMLREQNIKIRHSRSKFFKIHI